MNKSEVGSAHSRLAYVQEYINTVQKQPHWTSQATGGPYGACVTIRTRAFPLELQQGARPFERYHVPVGS